MRDTRAETRDVTLLELVDRLIDRGVVLSGNITISVADVDLIALGLRLILASTERLEQTASTRGLVLASPAEQVVEREENPGRSGGGVS